MRDGDASGAIRRAALRIGAAVLAGGALGVAIFLWLDASGERAGGPGHGGGSEIAAPATTAGARTPDPDAPGSPGQEPPADQPPADQPPAPTDPTHDPGSGDPGIDPGSDAGSDPETPGATDAPGTPGTPDASPRPFANSPGIEAAPEPDPTSTVPGAVGALPVAPEVAVPEGPARPVSAADALVEGFPTGLLPLAAGSTVLSSSMTGDGDRVLAAVEAIDTAPADRVMTRCTDRLVALGFTWTAAPATEGSTARSFTRDGHTVVVSVRPQTDGSLYRIVGILDEKS